MISKKTVLDTLDLGAFYRAHIPSLSGEPQASGKCPFQGHDDKKASLSVSLNTGFFNCHGCGKRGDVFTFYQEFENVDFKTALQELAGIAGVTQGGGKRKEAVYDYKDESGDLLYQVVRYEPKDFRPRRKGVDGEWVYSLEGVRRVPYNLPELINSTGAVIVEGEKDADNLRALGFTGTMVVTTSHGGAEGWRPEYAKYFLSKQVVIIPDNDQPGLKYAETVTRSLQGKASNIKILELPGLGERTKKHGLDISNWIEIRRKEGRTDKEIKGELTAMIKSASPMEPKADIPQEEFSGLVMLDTVTPEPVNWLWKGTIPLGKVSLIDGDPGLGKSTMTLDLVARVSQGASMPDGSPGVSGGAVLLTFEDGLADTIVPRLKAAGADLSRIVALQAVHDEDGKPRFPTIGDIEGIRQACDRVQAKIVVIDPVLAHLDGKVNSWSDQDIRGALTPLCKFADEIEVAVIMVRHLNKASGGQAIYRGGGSIGIIGAARCAYLVAKDPEDEARRIFAGVKNNLAPMPPSLSFSLEGADDGASRIVWGGVSNHGADALLAIPSSPEERTALDEAKEFLRDLLSDGAVESKEAQRQARAAGIAEKTLHRAKNTLGVRAEKKGYQGPWIWALNSKGGQEVPKAATKNNGHLWEKMATFEGKESPKAPEETPWAVEI